MSISEACLTLTVDGTLTLPDTFVVAYADPHTPTTMSVILAAPLPTCAAAIGASAEALIACLNEASDEERARFLAKVGTEFIDGLISVVEAIQARACEGAPVPIEPIDNCVSFTADPEMEDLINQEATLQAALDTLEAPENE